MPAKNEFGNTTKKKKGRAPRHQNKFAFAHNPASKKTEKITSMPNIHVCQRCCDKLEWRKKYRKYKPRSQFGTCNGCKNKNVKAAYHTICTKCTRDSVKAKELIKEHRPKSPETDEEETIIRACAVCVKEIALRDPEVEKEDRDYIDAMARLNLRQRRSLHRKMAKDKAKEDGDDDDTAENDNEDDKEFDAERHQPQGSLDALVEVDEADDDDVQPDYGDDANDPFLQAIGGADKLLTGEAYQRKLLQEKKEHQ